MLNAPKLTGPNAVLCVLLHKLVQCQCRTRSKQTVLLNLINSGSVAVQLLRSCCAE
jgi:hypothetical protein